MSQLRLEQYETVHYEVNLNPMGVPGSVKRALLSNIDNVHRYPSEYYSKLKKAISNYADTGEDTIVFGSGFSDLLRLFTALIMPKKAVIPVPCCVEYGNVLSVFGCETEYYELKESMDYQLDIKDFISKLDSSCDMVIIGNPNNPTSQIISIEDMESLASACKKLDIFLVVDEMYIEFAENNKALTAVPLTEKYENLAVLRSVSKFFCVPGLRFAYAVMNNPDNMAIIGATSTPNGISLLTAAACTDVFADEGYIEQSRSMVYTERNLIFSAMTPCKKIRLFKPYGNFMLMKILKDDLSAKAVAEHCRLKGLILRTCEDFYGLDDKYLRFCFMKPGQNDLLVNTILELM